MSAFLIYAIRWAVVLTLLYSLYALFMKRETLHGVNRIVLLLVLVASMVLPLCQIKTREANVVAEGRERLEQQIITVSTVGLTDDAPEQQEKGDYNVGILMLFIYIVGMVVAWAYYLRSLISLLLLIRCSKRMAVDGLPKGVVVLTHPSIKTPCSWMHWMLLPNADVQSRPIILHELSHIRLRHSWDMLLCELTCRMLWCVPFAWMLRQDLRDIHEYQADRRVLRSGIKDEEYQLLLIRKATGTGLQTVVNALNQSPIKKRFKMMYKKPSRRWVALKAAYLLPLGALSLVAFARPQALTEIEAKVEEEVIHYTATMKALVSTNAATKEVATADMAMETQSPSANPDDFGGQGATVMQVDTCRAEDNNHAPVRKFATTQEEAMMRIDSVMQAVGARKIAEGTYIGHFQPSLNNDTVRLAQVDFHYTATQKTVGYAFPQNATDPYAYKMTVFAQNDEKKGIDYHIRYLTPLKATDRHYDLPKYDKTLMLPTSNVFSPSSVVPAAIEQTRKETRIFMYVPVMGLHATELLKDGELCYFKETAIHDADTNDQYMFRSMDDSYFKFAKKEALGSDTFDVYQVCLVFPPLDKRVKRIWIGSNDGARNVFLLKSIPHRGQVITH